MIVVTKKHIVLCSDGTGNSGGKKRGTNVWRIFNAIDRHNAPLRQVTYYDDGVGTDTLWWPRLLGGAFGFGLAKNLRQLYSFLVMNYDAEDKVFLFGFSRGAFTVRSLAGMVCRCGVLDRDWFLALTRKERDAALRRVLLAYRSAAVDTHADNQQIARTRQFLNLGTLRFRPDRVPIEFLGVWDTVDAVGMPFDDLKIIDWLWRRLRRRRLWGFHDRTLSRHVHHAYHALALDDERSTFHPNVWSDATKTVGDKDKTVGDKDKTVEDNTRQQVWFAGSHSNVGGGYPKDSLSLVSLDWMMGNAARHGLVFITGRRAEVQTSMDAHGRLYDSRTGIGMFYRYAPRNIYSRPANPLSDAAKLTDVLGYTIKKYVWYVIRNFLKTDYSGGFLTKLRCRLKAYVKPVKPIEMPPPHIHASVRDRIVQGTEFYAPKVIRFPRTIADADFVWMDGRPRIVQRQRDH